MMPTASTYVLLCFRGVWGVPLSPPSGEEGSYQDSCWQGLSIEVPGTQESPKSLCS